MPQKLTPSLHWESLKLVLLLVGLPVWSSAQTTTAGTSDARFRHLTQADGFVQTVVDAITQDSIGFIWFGTWDGLYRYDGQRLKRFVQVPFDKHSLAYSSVKAIYPDGGSGLWICTDGGGIDHYDAASQTFSRAQSEPPRPHVLGSNYLNTIYRTSAGDLIFDDVTTAIYRLDVKTKQLDTVKSQQAVSAELFNDRVTSMDVFARQTLLAGTSMTGTFAYHLSGGLDSAFTTKLNSSKPRIREVEGILVDPNSRIWIGGVEGLVCFDPKLEKFIPLPPELGNAQVLTLISGIEGEIWIGTEFGLYRYDLDRGSLLSYMHDPNIPTSLLDGAVRAIFIDRDQVLWVGTHKGVSRLPLRGNFFHRVGPEMQGAQDERSRSVWSFLKLQDGSVLVGTHNGLFHRKNGKSSFIDVQRAHPQYPSLLGASGVQKIDEDKIIITVQGNVVALVELPTVENKLTSYQVTGIAYKGKKGPPEPTGCVAADGPSRKIWLSTLISSCPIYYCVDSKTAEAACPPKDVCVCDKGLYISRVVTVPSGDVYFGSYTNGLLRYQPATNTWKSYKYTLDNPRSLPNNVVLDLDVDSRGHIWIGTYGGGVSDFDPVTETFASFHSGNSDLINEVIYGLKVDAHDRVWLASNYGIAALIPSSGKVINFGLEHGLQNLEFNAAASYEAPDGELFFGGIGGYNHFYPDSILRENPLLPVVFTTLAIRGNLVTVDSAGPLKQALYLTGKIELSAEDRDFEIFFSAFDYAFPVATRVRYRLAGYNNNWTDAGNRRSVSYTNIDPGNYQFEVQVASGGGEFTDQTASLSIKILPPWYRSWWAYVVYALLLAGFGAFVYGLRQNRRRLRLAAEAQLREAEQLRELDKMKSNFFTNVSHEFRTPLTLIMGPLDDVLKDKNLALSASPRQQLVVARHNANRLHQLVEELLDISRLEAGQVKSRPQPILLEDFLDAMIEEFSLLAAQKGITLSYARLSPTITLLADPKHLHRIISNLLSNALKFTSPSGRVALGVSEIDHLETSTEDANLLKATSAPSRANLKPPSSVPGICIEVKDNGRGISPEDTQHIFNRFYRVDESQADHSVSVGTGIGLSLTRELVRLEGGSITVSSELGQGSIFRVCLPIVAPSTSNGSKIDYRESKLLTRQDEQPNTSAHTIATSSRSFDDFGEDWPTVLVVDDHTEIRRYIATNLNPYYKVIEAADGQEALAMANEQLPDLIISDVMMPRMSGLELCDALKTSSETSYIPIILLTAKAGREDELEGLRHRADDYVAKPFDAELLKARVDNLIEGRRAWKKRLQKELSTALEPNSIKLPASFALHPDATSHAQLSAEDQRWLDQVIEKISQRLSDETLTVEQLASELFISRSHLHRHLVALIDKSPSELIKQQRLSRAAELLQRGDGNVSEVAYGVGFKSVAHFSNSFTDAFGCRPSAYPQHID